MRRIGIALVLVAFGGLAFAKKKEEKKAEPKPDPMVAAMAKYMTPGPQHKLLTGMAGTWTVAGKFWHQDATKPPIETTGTAEIKAMGDLWVTQDFSGTFMGKPFVGHGIDGYDLTKNKYVGTWVDSMGSYIMNSEGTADASGKVMTYTANDFDPMTSKTGTVKEVVKIDSDKQHTMTMFKTGADGKEVKMMELVYTRK
jgi:hypothetical protein